MMVFFSFLGSSLCVCVRPIVTSKINFHIYRKNDAFYSISREILESEQI